MSQEPRERLRLHTQTWGVRKARAWVMPKGRCRKIGEELCVLQPFRSRKEEGAARRRARPTVSDAAKTSKKRTKTCF